MKLIKINTDHYIVVDDSEIKEGDWYISPSNGIISDHNGTEVLPDGWNKITHSTQPLEEGTTIHGIEHKRWVYIKCIDLSEVKELIGELDVEKKAEEEANKLSSILDPNGSGYSDYVEGYKKGYSQAIEDNKEKKYTEEDLKRAFFNGGNMKEIEEFNYFIKSLQPKTEWEVEIVDGKLKLK